MSISKKLHTVLPLFEHCNSQPNSICTYVEIKKTKYKSDWIYWILCHDISEPCLQKMVKLFTFYTSIRCC